MKEQQKRMITLSKKILVIIIAAAVVLLVLSIVLITKRSTDILELPNASAVSSITINQYNEFVPTGEVTITDNSEINQILNALSDATKTRRQSVNDSPLVRNYLLVCLNLAEGERASRTLFLYTNGDDYIEEPYVGIYRPNNRVNHLYSVYAAYTVSSDYRPMVFVQDNLYSETADVVSTLPDNTVRIGVIEKIVPRNEPMVRENFTSNLLPTGSEIYSKITDQNVIYVTLSDGRYSIYVMLSENSETMSPAVATVIERNLDEIIDNTLAISSVHPSEQVRWHTGYNEIIALGNDALQYMFSLFEQGGQNEFRGYAMAVACCDILGIDTSFGFRAFNTGQEWYDDYKLSAAQPDAGLSPTEIVRRGLSSGDYDIKYVFLLSVGSRESMQGLDYGEIATVYASYIDIDAIYNMRYDFERATCNSVWTHGEPQFWDGMLIDVAAHAARNYYSGLYRISYDDVSVSWASQEEADSLGVDFGSDYIAAFYIGRIGEIPTVIVVSSSDGQSHWKVVGYADKPV